MTATLQLAREAHGLSADLQAAVRANDARLVGELRRWFFAAPPTHRPSEWIEQNIILQTTGTGGKKSPWSFTDIEYMREPIDLAENMDARQRDLCWGTGTGKTTVDIGVHLHDFYWNPFTGIYVMPNLNGSGGAVPICRAMIDSMDASPIFAGRLPKGAARKTSLTRTRIMFGGNDIDFVGAHSVNQLASKRCRRVTVGEMDKIKEQLGREAGADYLIGQRLKGMSNTKHERGSTPSLEGFGIWTQLLGNGPNSGSDCRRRFLRCPSCGNGNNQRRNRALPRERTLEILRKHDCAEKIDQAMNWQEETE